VKRKAPLFISVIVCFLILAFWTSAVQAANPATINVTVTVQSLSVSATGPIALLAQLLPEVPQLIAQPLRSRMMEMSPKLTP